MCRNIPYDFWYVIAQISGPISGHHMAGIMLVSLRCFILLPFTRKHRDDRDICCKPVSTCIFVPGGSNAHVRYMDDSTEVGQLGVPTKLRPAGLGTVAR